MSDTSSPVVAFLGLGANLGDREATLRSAVHGLHGPPEIEVDFASGVASLYETSPVGGPPSQPDFLNSCIRLQTRLGARQLLELLRSTERQHGRVRQGRWGPRTLDLDLLLYGDLVVSDEVLSLPHPGILDRGFVLLPLAEIAGDVHLPGSGTPIRVLAERWQSRMTGDRVVRVKGPEWGAPPGTGRPPLDPSFGTM